MSEIATTKKQRDIMTHSLLGSGNAKKPFRNYFCVGIGDEHDREITKLIEMGLMRRGPTINDGTDYYAFVTEAGADEIGLKLPKESSRKATP